MATALVDLYGGEPLPFDRLILSEKYSPSEREEFMCDKHRAYFLRRLKDWKEAIIEESRATMAQLQVDSLREPDLADRASSETDWAIELRTRDRQRKLIAKIDAAIRRYEQQIKDLYCRDSAALFPPRGLDAGNSYFARYARYEDQTLQPGGTTASDRSDSAFNYTPIDRARIAQNPPTSASKMPASVPPATMRSASPRRIVSQASPIAWAPVAQADTVAKFGPSMPNWMATWPEPTLAMPIGMKNGLIRPGPRSAISRTLSNSVATPPSPEPRITPLRSASDPSIRAGRPA